MTEHAPTRVANAIQYAHGKLDELDQFVQRVESVLEQVEKECELTDLLVAYRSISEVYDRLDKQRKTLYKIKDRYDKQVIPQRMFDSDTAKVSVDSIGVSFYPLTKYSASVKDKEQGFEWLRSQGLDSLITETVNASTLASTFKEMILEQGVEPPEDLFNFTTYHITGQSKFTPKR
mgnify:CR=1 FL=1